MRGAGIEVTKETEKEMTQRKCYLAHIYTVTGLEVIRKEQRWRRSKKQRAYRKCQDSPTQQYPSQLHPASSLGPATMS